MSARAPSIPWRTAIPFFGFCVYPYHRLLRRRNGVAFARRFQAWTELVAGGDMTLDELHPRVRAGSRMSSMATRGGCVVRF